MSDLSGGRPVSVGGPLVIPVHLDALCPADDLDVRGPDNDLTRLPYRDTATGLDRNEDLPYLSEIKVRTPFQDEDFRFRAGVHVHGALPDGLTRMVQRTDGATAVPAVPNRRLVTRSRDGRVEEERVVESDYLSDDNPAAIPCPVPGPGRPYRRLGRKPPVDAWSRSTDRSRYLPELTAVGYGEPTFAAPAPTHHCCRRSHQEHRRGAGRRVARIRRLRPADDRDGRAGDLPELLTDSATAPPSPLASPAARTVLARARSRQGVHPTPPPAYRVAPPEREDLLRPRERNSDMTTFHVAVDHPDPDTHGVTTTYLGTVDQAHVDRVLAIAALPGSERHVKEHPRHEGAFMVLRDDGDLDVYEPTSPAEHAAHEPDRLPKTHDESGEGFVGTLSGDRSLGVLPHSASGPAYIDGVARFGAQRIGGPMDTPLEPPRAVWHTTESPAGGSYFTSVAAYLIRAGVEPQVIYCPVTDRLGQFGPLNLSSRALKNDGTKRTNRIGKVCIQIEVLGRAREPWTKGFDPKAKPNFQRLLTAIRAHGIPDVWPVGAPPATAAAATERPRTTWENKGGHYGHSQIPGQNHWDPGAIDTEIVPGRPRSAGGGTTPDTGSGTYTVKAGDTLTSIAAAHRTTVRALLSLNGIKDADQISVGQKLKLPTAAPAKPPTPRYEPFPGTAFFHAGRRSPLVTALGRRLVELGFGRHYTSGPGPEWSEADRRNVADFQRSRPELAGDADGIPGPRTWAALKIPKL